jgi:hypothetical protein
MAKSDKLPAIQFYPGDWLKDAVSGCSLAAQGLWLRMLFLMHESEQRGFLSIKGEPMPEAFIAKKCGATLKEFVKLYGELQALGIPSKNENGCIFSRRMVKDEEKRQRDKEFGKLGGNPQLVSKLAEKGVNPPVNPTDKPQDNPIVTPSSSSSISSSEINTADKKESKKYAKDDSHLADRFDPFWDAYGKKVGNRSDAFQYWVGKKATANGQKMTDEDRRKVMEGIAHYVQSFKEKQYQPYPTSFLNGRYFDNETYGGNARTLSLTPKVEGEKPEDRGAYGRFKNQLFMKGEDAPGFEVWIAKGRPTMEQYLTEIA